jgi:hypothetical protein
MGQPVFFSSEMISKLLFIVQSCAAVAVVAVVGSLISKKVQAGQLPWWSPIVSSVLGGLVWGWMCSRGHSLVLASIIYDVFAMLAYTSMFVFLGEEITAMQSLGVGICLTGLLLLILGGK